jgi:hypothetical protein
MTKRSWPSSDVADSDRALADIRSTLRLITWMLGLNTAGLLIILAHLFLR